jgi:predicted site-specific integrase-resolvase
MTGLSLQLKSIEEKTYNRISILEQKMDMGEKVKEEVSTLKTGLVNDVKAEIKLSLQNNIRTELKEIEDQKQRGLNLIIFNVPESKSENSLERKKFDKDIFTELCNAIEVVEADVKVSFRLGNPRKETNRPLKLVMNNKKHRKDIIENAPKLKVLPQTSRLAKALLQRT